MKIPIETLLYRQLGSNPGVAMSEAAMSEAAMSKASMLSMPQLLYEVPGVFGNHPA